MRGHPILQIGVLTLAIGLMGALIAFVLSEAERRVPVAANSGKQSEPDTVPTLLTITLSAPATSLSLAEPSGRIITISTGQSLEIEQDVELTLRDSTWSGVLSVTWQESLPRHFLRLDFEPDNLKSSHVVLDVQGDTENYPISTDFHTRSQ
ncbi:MAG: hypothetical protein CMP27_04330 [Roseibacillus sp.]|nr:hypothetical protein [Roseibacillus sp.]